MVVHSKSATNCSSTSRKQTFTFIRSKLETKLREFQKIIYLNGDIYNRDVSATTLQNALTNDIAVSNSGRTLAEILSLSQPNNLYTVDGVVPGYGREGTKVRYSRPESEVAELRREMQLKADKQERINDELKAEIAELKAQRGDDAEVLAEWQMASLVICAFGSYAWNLVSAVDKAELAPYKISSFWDLYHARTRPGTARKFARRIFHNIDLSIIGYAHNLISKKENSAAYQKRLAHPLIPDDRLLKFLAELGSEHADLEPFEVDMFRFLKSVSNTEENIKCAARLG